MLKRKLFSNEKAQSLLKILLLVFSEVSAPFGESWP